MSIQDLIILIPSHSLEDFPTELPDAEAAGLLNAFSASWHPQLIGATGVIPRWHRADLPPEMVRGKLLVVPETCRVQLPEGWIEQATGEGAVVVFAGEDRSQLLRQLLEAVGGERTDLDQELVADAIALGFCHLLSELLMRAMRQYSILDEGRLQREASAAAAAILANDQEAARTRLCNCFDVLTESRERFYPTECYLIDLCLVVPDFANDQLIRMLRTLKPTNLLLQGVDLEQIASEKPEVIRELKEAWARNTASLVGGEYREIPSACRSLTHLVTDFEFGREVFRRHLGKEPEIWGRRKFGLLPQLPQLLKHFGYRGALHLAMDDGLYPDEEFSKIRWTGAGGAYLDALTRIPMAAESASSYLRFPSRMSESMDHDQVAAIVFARWPEVKAPWFDDLRRMQNYSGALGRWTTLEDYFNYTDSAGRLSTYEAGDYLSPEMLHAVARQESHPIERHVWADRGRRNLETARFCGQISELIRHGEVSEIPFRQQQLRLDVTEEASASLEESQERERVFSESLLDLLMRPASSAVPGRLVVNPLSFDRKILVDEPESSIQSVITVPGCGFAWEEEAKLLEPPRLPDGVHLAEGSVLRNGLFEVELHERTGGIAKLKKPGRAPNRLSLQLAYRFPQERTLPQSDPQAYPVKSWYSRMEVTESKVLSAGPVVGELETVGRLVDQLTEETLSEFRLRYRVVRGSPYLSVSVELDPRRLPEGDPWSNYYALRWAWNDESAVLTRSQLSQPQGIRLPRFEAPDFFEIASDADRTTLLFGGLAFHRKTDDRMLDTILLVEGEAARQFQLGVAVDQNYPLRASADFFAPPSVVRTAGVEPAYGRQGWFFHIDVKSVQILEVGPVRPEPTRQESEDEEFPGTPGSPPPSGGCTLLIAETEGRMAHGGIRLFRNPRKARKIDARGQTVIDLPIEGDAVVVHLSAFETTLVEILF